MDGFPRATKWYAVMDGKIKHFLFVCVCVCVEDDDDDLRYLTVFLEF